MSRKLPPTPTIKRGNNKIQPKVEIVIACEGTSTEPKYLSDCVEHYGSGLVRLKILPKTGVPMTIVTSAIEARKELVAKRRASKDSFDACFRVWAMFDCDEHPRVAEALALAQDNKIEVAFSNPCFELWPILHLEDYGAQDDRHALQARLSRLMPSYNHEQGALVDFAHIKDHVNKALARAATHNCNRAKEACQFGNPSTTVGDLVTKIIQNGKRR